MALKDAHMEHTKPPEYVSAGQFIYREAVSPCGRAEPRGSSCCLTRAWNQSACIPAAAPGQPQPGPHSSFLGGPLEKDPPFHALIPCIPSSACQMYFLQNKSCQVPAHLHCSCQRGERKCTHTTHTHTHACINTRKPAMSACLARK